MIVAQLFLFGLLYLSALGYAVPQSAANTPGFYFAEINSYDLLKTNQQSKLYRVNLKGQNNYDYPIYLANLKGSRYQIGYDYGIMVGNEITEVYRTFLKRFLGNIGALFLEPILEAAIDWQWDDFLSKSLPEEYQQELKGLEDAGKQLNLPLYRQVTRVILLANAPGDASDFSLILIREWQNRHKLDDRMNELISRLSLNLHQKAVRGLQCSMFGVWGSRTVNGTLFSARNLDWNKDMGIAKYKLITVYNPDNAFPHATAGFIGMWGALAGASSQGLSVHEANLEENEITFNGFPWVLRLRWVMENAKDLASAKKIWESTQNTVGFNHMVTSANDVVNKHAALALETMYNYTAYFLDNDPREATAKYNNTLIGFPLEEALWRTNHGYDPTIRSHFEWSQSPSSWSMERYMFAHEAFTSYERSAVKIDTLQAINITSILGDKGKHAYQCYRNTTDGTNVLSVAFQPGASILNVAWENGTESSWTPAACNIYVQFDLTSFWSK